MIRIARTLMLFAATAFVFPLCAPAQPPTMGQMGQPLLQIRLASESARVDRVSMPLASSHRSVFVSRSNVASDELVERVIARKQPNGLVLEVTLSAEGVKRLSEATRLPQGDELAILLDKELVASAPIVSQLTSKTVLIGIEVSAKKAVQIKKKVDRKWPKPT